MANQCKPITAVELDQMVINHVVDNLKWFVPEDHKDPMAFLTGVIESVKQLANQVSLASIANRVTLSPLNTFDGEIGTDPEQDQDGQAYEIRFRLVEQCANALDTSDNLYTLDNAVATFGAEFVEAYWGKLGENCPKRVTTPDNKTLWFTAVRYPVASMSMSEGETVHVSQAQPGNQNESSRSMTPR